MDVDIENKTCYEKKKLSVYKWRENNKVVVVVIAVLVGGCRYYYLLSLYI